MKDQTNPSQKDNRQDEKHVAEEARRIAEEQKRKKAYFAKEEELEILSKIKASEHAAKRVAEEVEQSSKDQARKAAYLAREKDIADAETARKLGNQILK